MRKEEVFAFGVMKRAAGIDVQPYDDGSADSMVDGLFSLADGRLGAVEVTTLADPRALQVESTLEGTIDVPGALWSWVVNVGPGVRLQPLRDRLPALLLYLERHGWRRPDDLPAGNELLRWFHGMDIDITGGPETDHPGTAYLVPGRPRAEFVPDHLDDLPEWLEAELVQPHLVKKIDKLLATGRNELHLFLRIHDTGMPWQLHYVTALTSAVPTKGLRPPPGITGVWLATRWKNPMLWWTATAGWQRTVVHD